MIFSALTLLVSSCLILRLLLLVPNSSATNFYCSNWVSPLSNAEFLDWYSWFCFCICCNRVAWKRVGCSPTEAPSRTPTYVLNWDGSLRPAHTISLLDSLMIFRLFLSVSSSPSLLSNTAYSNRGAPYGHVTTIGLEWECNVIWTSIQ